MTTDPWEQVHAARRALADDLAGLTDDQWHHATLCPKWNVEDVVAHLAAAASVGFGAWLRSMLFAGLRPSVHNQRRLAEHRGATPEETLARFRAVIDSTVAPTSDIPAYLGEVLVHGEDIRGPLGFDAYDDVAAWTSVAEFYVARDFAVNSRTKARGLHLKATDGPFEAGTGPDVYGPTMAIVMTLAGRPDYLGELRGKGVAELDKRLA